MDNPNYVNYYIEILTNTMNDAIMRNVSLQANLRVHEEAINNSQDKFESLQNEIDRLNKIVDDLSNSKNLEVGELNRRIVENDKMKVEYENTRHQVQHLETFRNELTKEREENQKLRNEIELLKAPPKRVRKPKEPELVSEVTNFTQKDGGTF